MGQRICSSKLVPTIFPAASVGGWPETNIRLPTLIAGVSGTLAEP
jgi:hypothetical protein